jgi:cob(I)alamin adenosyltransferase
MVVLNKIYTRTGDDGKTGLSTGKRVEKFNLRIQAYGTVDETNATIGMARQHTGEEPLQRLDSMLSRIQNELFDLGADLCTPESGEKLDWEPLRMIAAQVTRLETEIDELNKDLTPLKSFILPGGHPAGAVLHLSRTVSRRAERLMVELADQDGEQVSEHALHYVNRLSDFLFVASRWANTKGNWDGQGDVLWVPGATR